MDHVITRTEIMAVLATHEATVSRAVLDAVEELLALQRERCAQVAAEMNAPHVAGRLS